MPNIIQRLVDRFIVVSDIGKVQTAPDVPLLNADLTTRDKCEVTMAEVIERRETRDCRNEDLIDTDITTRLLRLTLNYTEVTPHIMNRWLALFLGGVAAPVGAPANEVQTLTVTGSGANSYVIAATLEGRTVTTKPILATGSATDIQNALTAARMLFIQPGDVVVTGVGPFTLTFPPTGRLGRANIPLMVATPTGGTAVITAATDGAQRLHVLTRSSSRVKPRFSFALGWENVTNRVEKYAGFVVESYNPTAERNGQVGLSVSIVGPWEYDSIETTFTIPNCVNITPLQVEDVKVLVDGNYQTTDVNSLAITLNDNVPVDQLSAFGWDAIDVQTLERGDQPAYDVNMSLFGSEVDAAYQLAYLERTQVPVPVIAHFGQPGNRCSILMPKTKIRFQGNRWTFVGTRNASVIQLEGTPYRDSSNPPVSAEAYDEQATAFLTS